MPLSVIDMLLIIIPVFNDWYSLEILLKHLDEVLNNENIIGEKKIV